jgi:hypothetical protein
MFPLPNFTNQSATVSFRVWISDPSLADDLTAFLDATVYEAGPLAGDTLPVCSRVDVEDALARVELEVYLRMWRHRHPSETAEIVP